MVLSRIKVTSSNWEKICSKRWYNTCRTFFSGSVSNSTKDSKIVPKWRVKTFECFKNKSSRPNIAAKKNIYDLRKIHFQTYFQITFSHIFIIMFELIQ